MTDSNEDEKTTMLQGEQETLNRELQQAKEQEACLILIRGPLQGHRYFINQDELIIGRDPNAEISIADPSVSRKHAKVIRQGEDVFIEELGSSNGSDINGKKIKKGERCRLSKEDMVKIGNTILKFLPAGELEILFYAKMDSDAHTDPLTRIYNRKYLEEASEAELKRARAFNTDLSVLFFDLDHFKSVNDTYGHDAGDYVLREFSKLIKNQHVRPKDIFARYGGEEFVLVLTSADAHAAAAVGERIRSSVEAHPFVYEEKRIPITTSIGVSELSSEIETSQALFKKADQALYRSKEGGRNQVTVAN